MRPDDDVTSKGHDEITLAVLAKRYSNEDRARRMLERLRWPDGPVCPHCGNRDKAIYPLVAKKGSRVPCRKGLYCCGACREQFTVKVGTVMESSHIPISKWLMAIFIIGSSKKAISAHQMHRMLGVTYKTAWFLCHRVRHAMTQFGEPDVMKGTIEVDETYIGPKLKMDKGRKVTSNKSPVVALVQRDGDVRTKVVADVTAKTLRKFMDANIHPSATVNTDSAKYYQSTGAYYAKHEAVNHTKMEYSRDNKDGTTAGVNHAESFFSLLKRGVFGAFHHISKEHLPRYVTEFEFRWNHRKVTDGERMVAAVEAMEGKRLTYREAI